MERKRRRVWTFAVSAGAVLVIAAALASGLFQLAIQAVPGYRAEIERYVQDVTGRPVRIGALSLSWRYYYPALELQQVALLEADGGQALLEAERLRLGFGLTRLLRGEFVPSRLELQGLTLEARLTREGAVELAGLEPGAGDSGQLEPLLRRLEGFGQLQLSRCRLNLSDERAGRNWSFGLIEAKLERGLLGTTLNAEVLLPADFGERAQLGVSMDGDWLDPASWSGNGSVKLTGIAAGSWLTPYLATGAKVELTGAEASLQGRLDAGRIVSAELQLRSGPITARRAQHRASLQTLDARLQLQRTGEGWTGQLARFALTSAHGKWPALQGQFVFRGGAQAELEGQLGFLRLTDLAPWVQMVREPGALATLDRLAGELRDVQFNATLPDGEDPRYSLRARFEQLALPAFERAAGFAGASGELAADETGGRAILKPAPLSLELPGMLIAPTATFDSFEGELEWRRQGQAWTLHAPRLAFKLLGASGEGRLELLLPDAARSPELDLNLKFRADDVTAAKPLIPRRWGSGLRDWLDRSILSGRAESGTLVIKGPLRDFPFDEKPGIFKLDIRAADVLLAYQPDWPPIEQLSAQLRFRGNSLAIGEVRGVIGGNPIKTVSARFPDFSTAELIIDGVVEGETARFYEFLAQSPLRKTLRTLLRDTRARGPAAVEVHLNIPLREADDTSVNGQVTLGGVELRHGSLPDPVTNIEGKLRFSGAGAITAEQLTGALLGQELVANISPRSDGSSLLVTDFRFAPDAGGQGLSRFVPAWLLKNLAGASAFRAELTLAGDDDSPLRLRSDLVGMEIRLPPPLGKSAELPTPLLLTVGTTRDAPLRVTAEFDDRFGADLRFTRRGAGADLVAGALRAGAGPPIAAPPSGVILAGALAELDLRHWFTELAGSGLEQQAALFRRADLNIGRARWGEYSLSDTRYQLQPEARGWLLTLTGAGGAGELRWSPDQRGVLTARLDQLALNYAEASQEAGPASEQKAGDPNALPRLDLDIRRLSLNQADFGALAFSTLRTPTGQKIQNLKLAGGLLNLAATGEWRRRSGHANVQSSAALEFEAGSTDTGALLRTLGFAPTLEAKSAAVKGALRWEPAAGGIAWQQAQGTVSLDFSDGQLRAVNPGVGRVLGLFNFYALPRRLTLNFKDVVGSGLGFDSIQGDFALAGGDARTGNLRIAAPSLRMDLRGRVGLAARDYDQRVTVYPGMSAGVTLGALALGGPVAGALALIAQELLNKPLDQVTQLSYRVTGSWDNPQVERADEAQPVSEREPGPPSQVR